CFSGVILSGIRLAVSDSKRSEFHRPIREHLAHPWRWVLREKVAARLKCGRGIGWERCGSGISTGGNMHHSPVLQKERERSVGRQWQIRVGGGDVRQSELPGEHHRLA